MVSFFIKLILMALIFFGAMAEESSILEGALQSEVDVEQRFTYTSNALTDGSFKTQTVAVQGDLYKDGSKEFVIILPAPKTIVTSFVQNQVAGNDNQQSLSTSHIWAGNDS